MTYNGPKQFKLPQLAIVVFDSSNTILCPFTTITQVLYLFGIVGLMVS